MAWKVLRGFFLLITAFVIAGSIRIILVVPIQQKPYIHAKRPLNIAHRGGMGLWPENTIYAFNHAIEAGGDVLELDIWPAADGEIVVVHDETVDRTSDGTGQVGEMALKELKKLDFAFNFVGKKVGKPAFRGRGITICTLDELFRHFPKAYFNIEIKPDSPGFARKVIELVRKAGMTDQVVITSFHEKTVKLVLQEATEIATAASRDEAMSMYLLSKIGLGRLHQPVGKVYQVPVTYAGREVVTPSFIKGAHSVGQEVYVWTVDTPSEMKRFLEMGVDGIITNRPDLFAKVLEYFGK